MSKDNYTISKQKIYFSNIEDYNYRIRHFNRIPVEHVEIIAKTNHVEATFAYRRYPKPKYNHLSNVQPKRGEYVIVLQEDGKNEMLMEYFDQVTAVKEKHIRSFSKIPDGTMDVLFFTEYWRYPDETI